MKRWQNGGKWYRNYQRIRQRVAKEGKPRFAGFSLGQLLAQLCKVTGMRQPDGNQPRDSQQELQDSNLSCAADPIMICSIITSNTVKEKPRMHKTVIVCCQLCASDEGNNVRNLTGLYVGERSCK